MVDDPDALLPDWTTFGQSSRANVADSTPSAAQPPAETPWQRPPRARPPITPEARVRQDRIEREWTELTLSRGLPLEPHPHPKTPPWHNPSRAGSMSASKSSPSADMDVEMDDEPIEPLLLSPVTRMGRAATDGLSSVALKVTAPVRDRPGFGKPRLPIMTHLKGGDTVAYKAAAAEREAFMLQNSVHNSVAETMIAPKSATVVNPGRSMRSAGK